MADKIPKTAATLKLMQEFPPKPEHRVTLSNWSEGDYFHPSGMKGKKKLSKYFKDEKLSLIDKENSWLLCSEEAILWVIGKRADDRFKVTENTKQIIKFEII